MNLQYARNINQYRINDLLFSGETALKSSPMIKQILIPPDSLTDVRNTNGPNQYKRYVNMAHLTNYAQIALTNVLGLINKGEPEINVPDSMNDIIKFATPQNTPFSKLQDEVIINLFKFGLCGIKLEIKDNSTINELPRFTVIPGIDIIDCQINHTANTDEFEWILLDATEEVFDYARKKYTFVKRYKVLGIDADGVYYEALINQADWGDFNLRNPDESKKVIELVRPSFYSTLNFIPFIPITTDSVSLKWNTTSFIQNLINTTISIFQLDAELRMGLHMQANPFLAIYGSTLNAGDVLQGMFSVNVFRDNQTKAEFVSPSTAGMETQLKKLQDLKEEAIQQTYSIINVASNASGDALALRVQASTTSLVNLVKNVADGLQGALMLMAMLLGEDIDAVSYEPYIDFARIETGETAKADVMDDEEEYDITEEEYDEYKSRVVTEDGRTIADTTSYNKDGKKFQEIGFNK